jgi:hypothetical protein
VGVSIDDDPFDYRITKSGVVVIGRGGRTVMELGGRQAAALIPSSCSRERQGTIAAATNAEVVAHDDLSTDQ